MNEINNYNCGHAGVQVVVVDDVVDIPPAYEDADAAGVIEVIIDHNGNVYHCDDGGNYSAVSSVEKLLNFEESEDHEKCTSTGAFCIAILDARYSLHDEMFILDNPTASSYYM